jgi:hypothetical protein
LEIATAVLGCCTLRGPGRDEQIAHITKARCIQIANARGKIPDWVAGECAE